MLDEIWLQNLATGLRQGEQWLLLNPAATAAHNRQQLQATLGLLEEQLEASCRAFNRFAAPARRLELLSHTGEGRQSQPSLMLLLGRCHAKLQHEEDQLVIGIYRVRGYETCLVKRLLLHATPSPLGGLLWRLGSGHLLNLELITQLLLEELCLAWTQNSSDTP